MNLEATCPNCGKKMMLIESSTIEHFENHLNWYIQEKENQGKELNRTINDIYGFLNRIFHSIPSKYKKDDKSLDYKLSIFKNKHNLSIAQLRDILNVSNKSEESYLPLMYLLSEIKDNDHLWRLKSLIHSFNYNQSESTRKRLERATFKYLKKFYGNSNSYLSLFVIEKIVNNFKIKKLTSFGEELKEIIINSENIIALTKENKTEDALILLQNSFNEIIK